MFVPYASEIWTKSYGLNYTIFWAFWQKKKKKKKKHQKQKQTNKQQQQQNEFL